MNNPIFIIASGIFLENVVFARGLSLRFGDISKKNPFYILSSGILTLMVCSCATVFATVLRLDLENTRYWSIISWPLYFLSLVLAYFLIYYALFNEKETMALSKNIVFTKEILLASSLNIATFGIVIFSVSYYELLIYALLYEACLCIGLTLANLLVHAGFDRMKLCVIPKTFSGAPILFIYVGILSLAIYGLTGHALNA